MLATGPPILALLASALLLAPPDDGPPDLETPQSSLENFIGSCDRGDYARAALSMDLAAIEPSRRSSEGPELARRLKAVMDRQVWFKWSEVPDRPDGQHDGEDRSTDKPADPEKAQTNVRLYSLFLGDRDFEFRLQRLRPPDGPPVWAFSRQTVEHIPELYRAFGPTRLESSLPKGLRETKFLKIAAWQWIGFALILLAGSALGWAFQKGIDLALKWGGWGRGRAIIEAFHGPGALTVGLWSFYFLARSFLGLAGPILSVLEPAYVAVAVVCLVWFLQRLIGQVSALVCRRYEACDSDEANVLLTRISVARHVLAFAVVVVGAGVILGRFEWFRQAGMTLLASAGVAGLVLGIAAQRILGNVFAGLLLAVTQPVKTGDAIHFEGNFGWVEEIALTYLVIRYWDLRRVVVPIAFFLDRPFQNWSRTSHQLMLPIYVQADHRVDVGLVRAELKAILEDSPAWDRSVPPVLQLTAHTESGVELRVLCGAGDPSSCWELQCHVRERLAAFLRDHESGRFLPRARAAIVADDPARAGEAPAGGAAIGRDSAG